RGCLVLAFPTHRRRQRVVGYPSRRAGLTGDRDEACKCRLGARLVATSQASAALDPAEDFELEQRYHIEKRWLLNRMLQGAGVVSGLDVVAAERGTVTVTPGFAIDRRGREILVGPPPV